MIVLIYSSTVLGREVYGKGKHDLPEAVAQKLIESGLAKRIGALPVKRTIQKSEKKNEVVHRNTKRTVKQRRKRSRSKNTPKSKS